MKLYQFMWLIAFISLCIFIIVVPDLNREDAGLFAFLICMVVIFSAAAYAER